MNHKSSYQGHCILPCFSLEFCLKIVYHITHALFLFSFKKSVLGEYIDSRDAKGIADLLNEKLEAMEKKEKRKKSRNKVRTLTVEPLQKTCYK